MKQTLHSEKIYINKDGKKELSIIIKGVNILFIMVDSGEFLMGSSRGPTKGNIDELPQHCVNINHPFWIGKFPVTIRQWELLMDNKPYENRDFASPLKDSPVSHISWIAAKKYIEILSLRLNIPFRLPTEAEWEYSARAGSSSRFYWGDDDSHETIDKYTWYYKNTGDKNEKYSHEVGLKLPNSFGLYDMIGNIWEWCEDWYQSDYYLDSPLYSPKGPSYGTKKVLRGGSWGDEKKYLGCSIRDSYFPEKSWYLNGFRILCSKLDFNY